MSRQKQLIPMATGERLRQQREALGHELGDVATQLHIDEGVMRAIEDDRVQHMAPLYRRGYIRSYARFLDFDAAEIEEMLEEVGNELPELHTVFPEAGHPRQAERWIKATSYVLASLLVGTLAWQFTYEAVRLSQDRGISEVSPGAAGRVPGASKDATPTAGAGHVNASIAALEKLPRQRSQSGDAGAQAWSAIQQASKAESLLELTASGDSWVEITDATGRQLEMDLLRGGSSKRYRGLAPFSIQFGRASALKLTQNGEQVDLEPFTQGDVTQMTLQADGSAQATGVQTPPGG
jgi:cytoskeleton protein RodZ